MSRIFLISDNHFTDYDGPDDVIHIFKRPYKNSGEMNTDMIKKWNETVRPEDVVFSIGDFAWTFDEFRKYTDLLNGKKYFIMGNHDIEGDLKYNINAEYHETIFPIMSFFSFKKKDFILVHDPHDVPQWWNGWVIHGHHHWMLPDFPFIDSRKKNINVACELINYTPIDLEWILSLNIDTINRMDTIKSIPFRN